MQQSNSTRNEYRPRTQVTVWVPNYPEAIATMKHLNTILAAGLAVLVLTLAPAAYSGTESPVTATQIETAKTAAEHEAIAKLFEDEAASLTKKSEMHGEMARNFSLPGGKPFMAAQAKHCAALEKDYKAAAKQNLNLATIHHQMAKEAIK